MTDTTRRLVCMLAAQNVGVADAPQGILEGLASAYGNTFMGEYGLQQLAKGSFHEDLATKGGVIPIFYGHGWAKPSNSAPIGHAIATETAAGLKVRAELYINESPEARVIWMAAAAGALREWSIGFMADEVTLLDAKTGKPLTGGMVANQVVERTDRGTLLEASVVVKGANPKTTMTKIHEAPVPGALSDEEEQAIRDTIRELLAKLLAGEVAELQAGEGGLNPISALVSLLRDLGWYEQTDEADDSGMPQNTYYEAHRDELRLFLDGAPATTEDAVLLAEKTERAWALLGSAGGHKVLREACYDARGTNDNPEVNQT